MDRTFFSRLALRGPCVLAGLIALPAMAQNVPPFFGGGTVAYDPEVGVIQSGALLDAQATVSHDRKYVTINTRADNTRLRALVQFPVAQAQVAQGFVGGVQFSAADAAAPNAKPKPRGAAKPKPAAPLAGLTQASPDQIDRAGKSWILTRQGMYLLAPLP